MKNDKIVFRKLGYVTRITLSISFALILGSRLVFAQAGPPLVTDDPETPGDGHWEINTPLVIEKQKSEKTFEAPFIDLNYGLGDHIQLKYEGLYVTQFKDGKDREGGLDQPIFGVKWRFLDQDKSEVNMSIYPQFSLNAPMSSVNKGLVEEGTQFLFPVEVSHSFGDFKLDTEIGYNFVEHNTGEVIYSAVLGYEKSKQIEPLVEIHGDSFQRFNGGDVIFNVGARVKLTDTINFIFAVGRSFLGSGN